MKPDAYQILVHWITERETIRRKKEAGEPRPWTSDPILAEWRFCNVNRCDDRETRWIFEHIIAAHADSETLWFNLAIARFVNWSPALAHIGYFDEWNAEHFVCAVLDMQRHGEKVYTGAYMIPAGGSGVPKHEFLADEVFTPLWRLRGERPWAKQCSEWDAFFRRVRCMGDFLRNQIITDMKYTADLPRDATPDWTWFVLAGPGTQRGLSRLHGRPLDTKWRVDNSCYALYGLRDRLRADGVLAETPTIFDDLNNVSNCMCEFDKYSRVLLGEGTPRARYAPRVMGLFGATG
ncbi:MAG: hypothetical protein JWM87_780 [Candidatus Eremiobacteraeota bacterium]|nr:hypothetical protein [Candidatus Eremiobacteraeota bacterium]